jgi:hypothetical protein
MADPNWLAQRSSELAFEAARVRLAHPVLARDLYAQAAQFAVEALSLVPDAKNKTRGILGYSAASLLFKAGSIKEASLLATNLLQDVKDDYARDQLKAVVSAAWAEEAKQTAGVTFLPGQVAVSISGGKVVTGGAPLDLVLRQVKTVQQLFVRTIEFLSDVPFQGRGARAKLLEELCRPWIFQMPAGSYQFAIAIEEVQQLDFFRHGILPEQVADKFIEVLGAAVNSDPVKLEDLVPDKQYRRSFVQLARRLSPTDGSYERIRVSSPTATTEVRIDREAIATTAQQMARLVPIADASEEVFVEGVLRALDLDKDWLIVDTDEGPLRVTGLEDAMDDVIGALVNKKVGVKAHRRGRTLKFVFIDAV